MRIFARRRHEHDRHDRRRADANEGRHADLLQEIVPIADSALLAVKLVRKATLKVYPGAPHGMPSTLKDRINADLLAFIQF